MKPPADIFDFVENKKVIKLRKKRIISFVCIFLFFAVISGIYFAYQYLFIKKLEASISDSKQPESAVRTAYSEYRKFFSIQPNITGISFETLLKRHFRMDLPPAKKAQAEISGKLHKELIPEKFPVSMAEFQIRKEQEAQTLYRLAKPGDKVKIRSVKGIYAGVFNGMGSKGASVRIDRKTFPLHDLDRESKALFDPELNPVVQREYIIRECRNYSRKIEQFSLSVMKKELLKQGYFYHGKFYSPSEYLTALKNNSLRHLSDKKMVVLRKAKETELSKLPQKTSGRYLREPDLKAKQKKHR